MGFVTDWKGAGMGNRKLLLRFDEVCVLLGCKKDHVYDLLRDGKLRAHNPTGRPGTRGTKIITSSLEAYLTAGEIPPEKWTE